MKMEELKLKIVFGIMMSILIIPVFCQATFLEDLYKEIFSEENPTESNSNQVEVHNEVNVQTNTGGNVINDNDGSGQIIEDEARSEVHTETIINGQVVESTDINSTSGTSSEVSVKKEIEVNDGKANIHQEIEINGEKKVEDREIELENATTFTTTIESCTPTNDDNDDETQMATKTATETRGLEKEIENNIFDNIQNFVAELISGLKSLFQNIFRF